MAIKKKISELPECTDFTGLFTIGVDALNRSVKVSLSYIQTKVTELISSVSSGIRSAETATSNANTAAGTANASATSANSAATAATTAKTNADNATEKALKATTSATNAAESANNAAKNANDAASNAETATQEATQAKEETIAATEGAVKATEDAETATSNANTAASIANSFVPESMELSYPETITLGNKAEIFIKASLKPDYVKGNVLFLGDSNAVSVAPDGRISVNGVGTSTVHVIPTGNTALFRSVQVKVLRPTLRFASIRTSLRLTQSGGLRLT